MIKNFSVALALLFSLQGFCDSQLSKSSTATQVARTKKVATKATSKQKTFADRGKLETSLRFDGTALHGKSQSSPSTTVSVESDKYLENLLGARKNFDDRIAKENERN